MFSRCINPSLGCYRLRSALYLTRFGIRSLSSQPNPFLYTNDYKELNKLVKQTFDNTENYSNDLITNALSACNDIQRSSYTIYDNEKNSKPSREVRDIVDIIFNNQEIQFDEPLLKSLFLLNLPSPITIHLIEIYNQKNPDKIIPKETALIALRTSIWDGDFQNSIKITDLTVGSPNYIARQNEILKSGAIRLLGTSLFITFFSKYGIQQVIDMGLVSPGWKHLSSINSMILTYLINSSFFITIVKFGRQLISAGGDYLTWQKGTFYTHWFRYADVMMFSARIVEADRQLNLGESNPDLINELCRTQDESVHHPHTLQPGYTRDGGKVRLLEAKDNLEDLKLQAYWMGGGDGFEWVEPDQDPADLIWYTHLDQYNKPALNNKNAKSLKWADELINKDEQEVNKDEQ